MFLDEDGRYQDSILNLGPHAYRGTSVGSEATCHTFPGYKVALDMGVAHLASTVIPQVFITHGHNDHVGGLVKHGFRRDAWGMEPGTYYVPDFILGDVQDMILAGLRVAKVPAAAGPRLYKLEPVDASSRIAVGGGLEVRPFRAPHRIPCLGYGLWSKRKKLLPEFVGKLAPELIAAKRAGVAIDQEVEVPEVVYPGDTNLQILEMPQGDIIRRARVLLLECTFVDGEVSPADTHRTGHVHLEHLVQAIQAGAFDETEVLMLTHFSARYHPRYIRETLKARLRGFPIWERIVLLGV